MNEALKALKDRINPDCKQTGEYCEIHPHIEIYQCSKRHCSERYTTYVKGKLVTKNKCNVIGNCKGGKRCGACDTEFINAQIDSNIKWTQEQRDAREEKE